LGRGACGAQGVGGGSGRVGKMEGGGKGVGWEWALVGSGVVIGRGRGEWR